MILGCKIQIPVSQNMIPVTQKQIPVTREHDFDDPKTDPGDSKT